jgi:hypothetical protein
MRDTKFVLPFAVGFTFKSVDEKYPPFRSNESPGNGVVSS